MTPVPCAAHHGISLARGAIPGIKGGYFATMLTYPSELAQTFWTATAAFTTCLVVTIVVSMITRPRPDEELKGLVYSLTPRPTEGHLTWVQKPSTFAIAVLAMTAVLNVIFF